ncbi:MAG: DUF1330 domain-containing protein [Polyangiales bacterium]
MPSAYVIVDIEVTDPAKYEGYKALTPAAVAAAGGEFVVRGGRSETLEGDWHPTRVVVLRFPDVATARAFYDSPLYREARAARAGATAHFDMVVVEGA